MVMGISPSWSLLRCLYPDQWATGTACTSYCGLWVCWPSFGLHGCSYNAERERRTPVRLVSGPLCLDLSYHRFMFCLERCWEGDRFLRSCLLSCSPFLVLIKSPFCLYTAKSIWSSIVFLTFTHVFDLGVWFSCLCSNSPLLPLS